METTIPRPRRARVFSFGAAIALVALLLPATAGIALGHTASPTCSQITNDSDPAYGVYSAQVYPIGSTTSVGTIPADTIVDGKVTAVGALTVAPGSYWVKWSDGYTEGLPTSENRGPVVVGQQCSPSVSTVASSPSTGTAGVPTTVGDTATLHGPVTFVTGTLVTFTLYSDIGCTTSTGVTGTGALGSSGVATFSQSWTPSAAGTYYWGVSFPGDTYNSAVSACGGEAETVVVSNPPPTSPPTSPPCTAANNCYFNTPSPSPSVSPSVSPSPSASPSPSPTPTSAVLAATSKPRITPPPTSSLGGTTGGLSSGIWLVLLVLAGLLGSILLLTPAPARARRKR